jgi:hypothetical protein
MTEEDEFDPSQMDLEEMAKRFKLINELRDEKD